MDRNRNQGGSKMGPTRAQRRSKVDRKKCSGKGAAAEPRNLPPGEETPFRISSPRWVEEGTKMAPCWAKQGPLCVPS